MPDFKITGKNIFLLCTTIYLIYIYRISINSVSNFLSDKFITYIFLFCISGFREHGGSLSVDSGDVFTLAPDGLYLH